MHDTSKGIRKNLHSEFLVVQKAESQVANLTSSLPSLANLASIGELVVSTAIQKPCYLAAVTVQAITSFANNASISATTTTIGICTLVTGPINISIIPTYAATKLTGTTNDTTTNEGVASKNGVIFI